MMRIDTATQGSVERGWLGGWGAALLALAAMVPVLVPAQPWLTDLPAHLARFHIQEGIAQSPPLARHFVFQWRFIPNLGVDLLVHLLAPLFGVLGSLRLIVAAIPALTLLGLLWIARETHGRVTATGLFALPLVYAYPFNFGFLNACLSVAIALIVFAGWLRLGNRGRFGLRAAALAVATPIVLVAHITGFGVLGVLVGGATLASLITERARLATAIRRIAVAVLPLVWPLPILMAWRVGGDNAIGDWLFFRLDLVWLVSILRDRNVVLDLCATAVLYGVAALPLLLRRRYSYVPTLAIPALVLTVLALTMPNKMLGAMFVFVRLIPVACALAILAVRERVAPPRWVGWLALALFASRLTSVTISQMEADAVSREQLRALDHIAVGSRVASFQIEPCGRAWPMPRLWHLASFATTRRDALVNDQFATAAGQTLAFRDTDTSALGNIRMLAVTDRACAGEWDALPDLLKQVRWDTVDYLWILHSRRDVIGAAYPVRLVWNDGHSQLYTVVHKTIVAPTPRP